MNNPHLQSALRRTKNEFSRQSQIVLTEIAALRSDEILGVCASTQDAILALRKEYRKMLATYLGVRASVVFADWSLGAAYKQRTALKFKD